MLGRIERGIQAFHFRRETGLAQKETWKLEIQDMYQDQDPNELFRLRMLWGPVKS